MVYKTPKAIQQSTDLGTNMVYVQYYVEVDVKQKFF